MNWYYAQGTEQRGPCSDAEFEALIQAGTIAPTTLVWREGMPNWQPLAQVQPGAAATPPMPEGSALCSQCRGVFPQDQVIQIGAVSVCAACKPTYVQKIREGVSISGFSGRRSKPVDVPALLQELDQRDFRLRFDSCISRGWALVKRHLGYTAAVMAIFFAIAMGVSMIGNLFQLVVRIPLIGAIPSMLIEAPMKAGLYVFFLKLIREDHADIPAMFSGFSKVFGKIIATYVLMMFLLFIWLLPGGIMVGINVAALKGATPNFSAMLPGMLLCFVGLIPMMYLAVCFMFALPLVIDLELGPVDALRVSRKIVHRNWLSMLVLVIVLGLINILGVLACFIGLLVTVGIYYSALMYAYEDAINPTEG